MDPNANLDAQIEIARRVVKNYQDPNSNGVDQDDANQLAELVIALDDWIREGGFLPRKWL